ncbi:hypothetical protein RFI_16423 [Reticulomyxa filosa]|uniref:Tetratricopeptide repeat protein 26 n=1 Tax=Reticulomyxa filosa TaxID=46433 RepID=X6N4W0_RETFI|nr:hypothetical protein RFI_16423 [Reticulomyxa filosa]|eukprot:ETO20794.1 hypothetical protein RFI_16423 [Reticulomyxa filosa]
MHLDNNGSKHQLMLAEQHLLNVVNPQYRLEYVYLAHLCRCFVMSGRPWEAWQLYLQTETNSDSWNLLYLIANDCYKMGAFYYAAKAFDALETLESTLDLNAQYYQGKRASICGVFQMVICGKEMKEHLLDVLQLIENDDNPQTAFIFRVIRHWCDDNDIHES